MRDPIVTTYSIVARDETTGRLGVAVQSHWFSVGPIVPWAEAGIGAVATQSLADPSYGPKGLALMESGIAAPDALDVLVAADEGRDVRQVAMIDASGRAKVWTGPKCIAEAGHVVGVGYTVQANLMAKGTVPDAMAAAYEKARDAGLPLAERMIRSMEAAEAEGGDIRGKQSAALVVVSGVRTGRPWSDTLVDLRVDDHADPLAELRRLWDLHRAYELMNRAERELMQEGAEAAEKFYAEAAALAPEQSELSFWQAVTLYEAGEKERALELFGTIFARDPRWVEVAKRLPPSGLLNVDAEELGAIVARAPSD